MQIDWLTVVAQIINFLILVWLLKRFLYQPVINAMDRREQRIAERLHSAERREQTAIDTTRDYRSKIETLERDRDQLMEKASRDVEKKRQTLLEQARSEVVDKRSHWQHQLTEEKQDFVRSLTRQTADAVQTISRRALADLANAELEQQIIQSFIQRLKTLDQASRDVIVEATGPVRIMTSHELEPAVRDRLMRAVHENIAEGLELTYTASADLLCGIELTAAGQRLGWTLAEYLLDLEQRMNQQLEAIGDTAE